MKKLVKVEEIEGEGLVALLGEQVMIFCMNYIYAGTLSGVNSTCIQLTNAHIVYVTGAFTTNKFEDAQKVGEIFYVQANSIESFGVTKKVL